jgi:coenzyme PQQ precursor peptide PqqA
LDRINDRPKPIRRKRTMKTWRKPKVIEIAVGNEINAYACADL